MAMLIGASMAEGDIPTYKTYFPHNSIMRVFPVDATVNGKTIKVLAPWTNARLTYCKDNGVIPFMSCKVDGDADGLAHVKNQLINMPSWVTQLYLTDRHEPEADLSATAFRANFKAFLAMVDSLPAATRAKVKCGPVLTKTWTETSAAGKGNFNYSTYDPMGVGAGGDFFGVDMYVMTASGPGGAVVTPATLPTAAAFVQYFKAYRFDAADTRPRIWPELGVVGMPADTDGTARANWLQAIYNEVKTWNTGTTHWPWLGMIWWNATGKATGTVPGVGDRRDFPLHLRTTGSGTTADPYRAVTIPGNPPPPVATFNAIWTDANGSGSGAPQTVPVGMVTEVSAARAITVTGGTPGGGGGSATGYVVGATMQKADLAKYEPMLARNGMMRIFPNSDGLPPAWSDPRFAYCQRNGTIPFVSSNIDGDSSKFAAMKQWIIDMPSWVTQLYLTDRHEPENNYPNLPDTYKSNWTAWWNACIVALPATTRAKVKAGHVLTRQWIEGGATKGNDNYAQYDTGLGDFYGVDFYMDSWKPGGGTNSTLVADAYKDPVAFLAKFKAYRFNTSDTRDRIFPEMGAIGIPADTDGSLRAAWIRGICTELDSWTVAAQGWRFIGWIWWNNVGTGGSSLTPIGTTRYFYLDQRQIDNGGLATLPGSLGGGRVGVLAKPQTLEEFAATVAAGLPRTQYGVRVSGDPKRRIESVAVVGGAGDSEFERVRAAGVDAYVTADLRHHPATEARAYDEGPALVDVAHWASEWPWLEDAERLLTAGLAERGSNVETHISTLCTDAWTYRL